MDDEPLEEVGSQAGGWRKRLDGWPAASLILLVGALVLVTGAVLLWLVLTTLIAFIRTVF